MSIPNKIFIIPYRNREAHKLHFEIYMKYLLEDIPDNEYKIFFIHQNDERPFNRGAMKNIGFIITKKLYPNDYKNITLIFNDIDTVPYKKNLLDYYTKKGIVKHFFGFNFCLGGIVSINAEDFENIGGFCNNWAWGFEDNVLNERVKNNNIKIDRSNFYKIHDMQIIHLNDGIQRLLSKQAPWRHSSKTFDTLNSITNIEYKINGNIIDINNFQIPINYLNETFTRELTPRRIKYDKNFKPNNLPNGFKFFNFKMQ